MRQIMPDYAAALAILLDAPQPATAAATGDASAFLYLTHTPTGRAQAPDTRRYVAAAGQASVAERGAVYRATE